MNLTGWYLLRAQLWIALRKEGYTVKKIAERNHVSIRTVYTNLHQYRKQMEQTK
jgi:transposase